MAYRLREDEPIIDELARIVLEQIDRSFAAVANPQLPRREAVHEVRQRCKKIRGLLRLARSALPGVYRMEDDWFRDASRKLASVRQSDAILLALESLRTGERHRLDDEVLDCLRDVLAAREPTWEEEPDVDARLAEFTEALRQARRRVEHWSTQIASSHNTCAAVAIMDGFERGYRRGRESLRTAERVQADEYLHEFRKWAKYHWHHARLLEPLDPKRLRRRAGRLAELSEWLGDERDLAALRLAVLPVAQATARLAAEGLPAERAEEVEHVVAAIDRGRARLRGRIFRLAEKLYQEKPKAYARRLGRRWKLLR